MDDATRVARAPRAAPPTQVPHPAFLVLVYAPDERYLPGHKFSLTAENTLGRENGNTHPFYASETLSRFHARIAPANGTFVLTDLQSSNGTFVNEQETQEHTLRSGDFIRLGRVVFRYFAGETAQADYFEELHRLAVSEPRTGLPNERHLTAAIERALSRTNNSGALLSLVLVSIDQLSDVFDHHGPIASDHLVREVAHRLRPFPRPEDLLAAPTAGGDFSLLLPDLDGPIARSIGERIRAGLASNAIPWGAEFFRITASIGVAPAEIGMVRPDTLIHAAQFATGEAVRAGGNRVALLDGTLVGGAPT